MVDYSKVGATSCAALLQLGRTFGVLDPRALRANVRFSPGRLTLPLRARACSRPPPASDPTPHSSFLLSRAPPLPCVRFVLSARSGTTKIWMRCWPTAMTRTRRRQPPRASRPPRARWRRQRRTRDPRPPPTPPTARRPDSRRTSRRSSSGAPARRRRSRAQRAPVRCRLTCGLRWTRCRSRACTPDRETCSRRSTGAPAWRGARPRRLSARC